MSVSIDHKAIGTETHEKVPWLCSCRFILVLVGFFGFVNIYALRVNLSVAMVCMVNHTAIHRDMDEGNQHNISQHKYDVRSYDSCAVDPADSKNEYLLGDNISYWEIYQIPQESKDGEFKWSKSTQGMILGAFFWGYLITQIPGGWLAIKFGGKRILGWGMFVCAVATLLTPYGAMLHPIVLGILRVLVGMSQGVVFPAINAIWSYWAPPLERSRLLGFTLAGSHVGNVLTFPIAGLLCEYGFAGGWPSIFYILGSLGLVWFILWMWIVHDTPEQHPRISQAEKQYIQSSLHGQTGKKLNSKITVPWYNIMRSGPVWAVIVALTCGGWMEYSFLTTMPTYLREVLKFDITQNGLISSLPYLGIWVMTILSGIIADTIRSRNILGTTGVRKLNVAIGMFLPAIFCIALGYLHCSQWILAVTFLTLAISTFGFSYGAGYFINYVDIAPRYSSLLFAIANTVASIPGFVAPYAIGVITSNQSQDEWRIVFYITAVIVTLGCIFYLIFGSGDLQTWAQHTVTMIISSNQNLDLMGEQGSALIIESDKITKGKNCV